jgi:hypothetical protein
MLMFNRSTKRRMRMDDSRAMAQTIIRRPIVLKIGVPHGTILSMSFSIWFLTTFNSLHTNKRTKNTQTEYKITYTLIAKQHLIWLVNL